MKIDNLIIGSGLAGLSCSYHLGHENCLILESKPYPLGHIYSENINGFTWDEGPHVSFTKNDYVKDLFEESVEREFEEYDVIAGNYFNGHWIEHPAQSCLYQIPEPLRSKCLKSFLDSRSEVEKVIVPNNYQEWLELAFGKVFANNFPRAYTKKYWTVEPVTMSTNWIGSRVFYPSMDEVLKGSKGPLGHKTHYIKKVRYPSTGGYQEFGRKLSSAANIRLNSIVNIIDLDRKIVKCLGGEAFEYKNLINTMPLPKFVRACINVPQSVMKATNSLLCTSVQLVNVTAPHETMRKENWMYVYDKHKYSVRINCTEKLSPKNAPRCHTGVQVEVYYSRNKPLHQSVDKVEKKVIEELIEMGLVCPSKAGSYNNITSMSRFVDWANIVFEIETPKYLNKILTWLESKGLAREIDDIDPLTDWELKQPIVSGALQLAGRYGQWKYYWTDDCILRGKFLANCR